MGNATFTDVRTEFEKRVGAGEFIEARKQSGGPSRAFTTEEMIGYEREIIQMMREGQNEYPALASFETRREIDNHHPHLSHCQRVAVEQILASRDQVMALEGVAGAGKTTSLAVVREAVAVVDGDRRAAADGAWIDGDVLELGRHIRGNIFLMAAAQVLREKFFHRGDHRQVVDGPGKAVTFIRRHQVAVDSEVLDESSMYKGR